MVFGILSSQLHSFFIMLSFICMVLRMFSSLWFCFIFSSIQLYGTKDLLIFTALQYYYYTLLHLDGIYDPAVFLALFLYYYLLHLYGIWDLTTFVTYTLSCSHIAFFLFLVALLYHFYFHSHVLTTCAPLYIL